MNTITLENVHCMLLNTTIMLANQKNLIWWNLVIQFAIIATFDVA
jgi:hypothetical protein